MEMKSQRKIFPQNICLRMKNRTKNNKTMHTMKYDDIPIGNQRKSMYQYLYMKVSTYYINAASILFWPEILI